MLKQSYTDIGLCQIYISVSISIDSEQIYSCSVI
jgi:hypothetical protein